MPIKGEVKIELFRDGEKTLDTGFKDNFVTSAYQDIINKMHDANRNVGNFINTGDFLSFAKPIDFLGGVVAYEDAQTENTNNYIGQGNVTGYAGSNVASADTKRGTLNPSESGRVGTIPNVTGFKFVWDFATDEAIGAINAVSLVPERGGNGQIFSQILADIAQSEIVYYSENVVGGIGQNEDASIIITCQDITHKKYTVSADESFFKFELVQNDGNVSASSSLTLTDYSDIRGVTFSDGFWYVLAWFDADENNRIVKLDDDFVIQQFWNIDTSGNLLIPDPDITEQFWSYSLGIINGKAIFCTDIVTATSATFKAFDLTTESIDTIVTNSFSTEPMLTADLIRYKTLKDGFGNEMLFIHMMAALRVEDDKMYEVMIDKSLNIVEEFIPATFGQIYGFVGTNEFLSLPCGGLENIAMVCNDATDTFTSTQISMAYYSRLMMTIFNLASEINKTGLDEMKITYILSWV